MTEGTRSTRVSLVLNTWISCNSFGKGLNLHLEEERSGLSDIQQGCLSPEVQEYNYAELLWICRGEGSKVLVSVEAGVAVPVLQQETSPHRTLHTIRR